MKTTDLYIYVATGRRPGARKISRQSPVAPRGVIAAAARELGVCYQHLALVLTGRRESRRLLAKIEELPQREKEAA